MKKRLFVALLAAVLLITACVPSIKKDLDKAEDLVKDEEYKDAIKIYEKILDKDETQYEAWNGLVEVYIEDKEYKDADEVLEDYFKVVKDEYEEDEDIDYDDLLKEIQDYGKDILDEDEEVGDWYEELNPPMIDLSEINPNHSIDEPLELDVPKDVDVYYTLDGSKVSDKDDKYKKKGIEFEEAGAIVLTVVAINEFGIKGKENSIELSIYGEGNENTGGVLKPLIPSTLPGTYEGPITIYFNGYEDVDIYFTLDGRDPMNGELYYLPDEGINLVKGDYELKVIYYDIETDTYSDEMVFNYVVEHKSAITVDEPTEFVIGIYEVGESAYNQLYTDMQDIMYLEENVTLSIEKLDDISEVASALEIGEIDAYYGPADYVEDLAYLDLIAPINSVIDLEDYIYYNNAPEAGEYKDQYFTMPVVIRPWLQLYVYSDDVTSVDIDTWDKLISVANEGKSTYNFLWPEDEMGDIIFGIYLGQGGRYEKGLDGQFILDQEILTSAIKLTREISSTYGLGYSGMNYDTYAEAIRNTNVTMVLSNDWVMIEEDMVGNYVTVGLMPLPDNRFIRSINSVDGFHINDLIIDDINKMQVARMVYEYVGNSERANYISSDSSSIAAIKTVAKDELTWLLGGFLAYERAVNGNITAPITYQFIDVYDNISYYYREVIEGSKTAEEAAKAIISGVIDYELEY